MSKLECISKVLYDTAVFLWMLIRVILGIFIWISFLGGSISASYYLLKAILNLWGSFYV